METASVFVVSTVSKRLRLCASVSLMMDRSSYCVLSLYYECITNSNSAWLFYNSVENRVQDVKPTVLKPHHIYFIMASVVGPCC
jgi:hypothetical protein